MSAPSKGGGVEDGELLLAVYGDADGMRRRAVWI
jgi:hypothetical protein